MNPDYDTHDRVRSLAHLKNPDAWIYWPMQPMKRRDLTNSKVDLGVIREVGDNQYQFCEGFMRSPDEREWRDVTPDQIIEEGWVVD